jgi:hypothetical protein
MPFICNLSQGTRIHNAFDEVASSIHVTLDSARHIKGCLQTPETRVHSAFDNVASTIHQSPPGVAAERVAAALGHAGEHRGAVDGVIAAAPAAVAQGLVHYKRTFRQRVDRVARVGVASV